jgi:hypothetical protein
VEAVVGEAKATVRESNAAARSSIVVLSNEVDIFASGLVRLLANVGKKEW